MPRERPAPYARRRADAGRPRPVGKQGDLTEEVPRSARHHAPVELHLDLAVLDHEQPRARLPDLDEHLTGRGLERGHAPGKVRHGAAVEAGEQGDRTERAPPGRRPRTRTLAQAA